jgi:hypothetical protein
MSTTDDARRAGPPTVPAMRTLIDVLLSLAGGVAAFLWLVP